MCVYGCTIINPFPPGRLSVSAWENPCSPEMLKVMNFKMSDLKGKDLR